MISIEICNATSGAATSANVDGALGFARDTTVACAATKTRAANDVNQSLYRDNMQQLPEDGGFSLLAAWGADMAQQNDADSSCYCEAEN